MGATNNMIHDLMVANEQLKEESGNLGFMRDASFIPPSYAQIQRGMVLPQRRLNYTAGSTEPAPGTIQSIMRHLTAEEFFILTHTHYMCKKETIQKFVDIIQGLIDQGEFDEPKNPLYSNNPWGNLASNNSSGWESNQVDWNEEKTDKEGEEND